MTPIRLLLVFSVFASLVAFVVFAADKRRARSGARRIPERNLHLATLLGAPGAIAAIVFLRHKTKKPGFLVVTATATLVHAGLLALALRELGWP